MIRLFAALALLSSLLAARAVDWVKINGREAHPTHVIVKYKANLDKAALALADSNLETHRKYSHIARMAVVQLRDQASLAAIVKKKGDADPAAILNETIRQLQASGLFEYVQPDYVRYADRTPNDSAFANGTLWDMFNNGQQGGKPGADINVVPAWDITTGDTNVVVAVIDTGINYTHKDLAAQMWVNPGEIPGNGIDDDGDGYVDNVYGINAITGSGDPKDDAGHGSHCAGTIGAAANNGFPHVGVCWNIRLMALKFLSSSGSGLDSDAIECINFSILKKVKITSNSWGGIGFDQALLDAITAARNSGQLFVAAAGNDGEDNDSIPHYPASYDLDNIISVAALDRFDKLADFSDFGIKSVDIGAPGVEIFSCWFDSDTAYNTIDGTSMACPHVAGAAALLLAADPTADYSRLRDRILQNATPIPALTGKVSSGGRLNVFAAMSVGSDGILEISVLPPSGAYFLTNSVTNITVHVTDGFNVNNATVVGRFNNQTYQFTGGTNGIYAANVTMPSVVGTYDLTLAISASGKVSTNVVLHYDALPKPPNDDFENAAKIPPQGTITQADNRLATIQLGEPQHAGVPVQRSLWWSWSTTTSTPVIVDTAGTSFDDDAVLAIYNGPNLTNLIEVGSSLATANGANGTRAPFVKFTAQPNLTYWIAVAQTSTGTNSPGRVVLRLQPNGDIDTTPPTVRVTNYLSGIFIRSQTNIIVLSGMAEDPPPNASGIRESDGVQYKVNNDLLFQSAIGSSNWTTAPIKLQSGVNNIYIKAFDRADNESGTIQFTVNYNPQTILNDLFGFATTLTDVSGSVTATNSSATKEFGEPAHGGNEGGHSLWWAYTPPTDGVLLVSTRGSTFDTLLGVYTMNDPLDHQIADLVTVAENDDSPDVTDGTSEVSVTVQGGKLYYIAVDGFGGQTGIINLAYNFTPLSVFNLTTSSAGGGTVSPGPGTFPANSAVTVTATPDRYMQFNRFLVTQNGSTTAVTSGPMYTFTLTGNTQISAEFTTKQFADDFQTGDFSKLPWQISSSADAGQHWIVAFVPTNSVTGEGSLVARVRPRLPDSTTASLVLVTNLAAGRGSFEFTVNSETNYDKFEFSLDGQVLGSWSGFIPWQTFFFDVPAKATPIRLEWRYSKDLATTVDNELVAIDNLDVKTVPPPAAPPVQLTVSGDATEIAITATAPINTDLQLQSSTDLVNWSPVAGAEQNSGSTGSVTFIQSSSGGARFYRVVQL